MKVLYVGESGGLSNLSYHLRIQDKELNARFLTELLEAGYLQDVTELFGKNEDLEWMRASGGVLDVGDNIYDLPFSWDEKFKRMRTDDTSIEIHEKYNAMLKNPLVFSYKEIKPEDFDRMVVVEWEDGSESILFNE